MISQSSAASRRQIAEPTIPRWPATQTRFPLREYNGVSIANKIRLSFRGFPIGGDHFSDKVCEARSVAPAEFLVSLFRTAKEQFGLRWSEIARVDFCQNVAALRNKVGLIDTAFMPFNFPPHRRFIAYTSVFYELLDGTSSKLRFVTSPIALRSPQIQSEPCSGISVDRHKYAYNSPP